MILQNLRNECEADMKFALSVLENGGTTPLPPTALQKMRQHQYHNSARLHKLLHFIEVCVETKEVQLKITCLQPLPLAVQ